MSKTNMTTIKLTPKQKEIIREMRKKQKVLCWNRVVAEYELSGIYIRSTQVERLIENKYIALNYAHSNLFYYELTQLGWEVEV